MFNPRETVVLVFYTDAPPDMPLVRSEREFCGEQLSKALGPLREHLVRMPVRLDHDTNNVFDKVIWNILLEEIAHAVYKNRPGSGPFKWFGQLLWNDPQVESLLVRMPLNPAKSLSECLRVTMF